VKTDVPAATRARRRVTPGLAAALVAASLGASPGAQDPVGSMTPPEHRRATEQTFLTFPEWFLVFSPAEYAAFLPHDPASRFPFLGHVRQFWQGYRAIWGATRDYPMNREYHVMIVVIGLSTTVEYGLRAAYETLVGRLSEITTTYGTTEEDQLAARVAQDYVDFIRVEPWYKFDFAGKLAQVWRTNWWGADPLRKWERKYALTTDYGAKAVYGWLMGKATRASYGEAVPVTAVLLDHLPADAEAELPELRVLLRSPDGSTLVTVPRYEAFTRHALVLARRGARFREIAGNRSVILVSAVVPRAWQGTPGSSRVLFTQDVLTDPSIRRVVLVVPVDSLEAALNELAAPPLRVEHVYDY
jgi:hypothetical protein